MVHQFQTNVKTMRSCFHLLNITCVCNAFNCIPVHQNSRHHHQIHWKKPECQLANSCLHEAVCAHTQPAKHYISGTQQKKSEPADYIAGLAYEKQLWQVSGRSDRHLLSCYLSIWRCGQVHSRLHQAHSYSIAVSLDKHRVKRTPSIMQLDWRGSSSCNLNFLYLLLSALHTKCITDQHPSTCIAVWTSGQRAFDSS